MARTLNAAYGDGLLSHDTLVRRLDVLFGNRLIDPAKLIGDLPFRSPRRTWTTTLAGVLARPLRRRTTGAAATPHVLGLDWTGATDELTIGRHPACDVVLSDPSVSRRHARLRFRDGTWMLQDLESHNGTWVNDVRVGRCQLRPGDHVELAGEHLLVD
jgi:FHA domain